MEVQGAPGRNEKQRVARWIERSQLEDSQVVPGDDERRTEARYQLETRGACSGSGLPSMVPIEVVDLSMNGMRFVIGRKLEVGEKLNAMVLLPNAAPRRVALEVRRVSRMKNTEAECYEIGARIDDQRSAAPTAPRAAG